jgi:hypothetical protein
MAHSRKRQAALTQKRQSMISSPNIMSRTLRQKLAALTKWEDYVMKIIGQRAIAA